MAHRGKGGNIKRSGIPRGRKVLRFKEKYGMSPSEWSHLKKSDPKKVLEKKLALGLLKWYNTHGPVK